MKILEFYRNIHGIFFAGGFQRIFCTSSPRKFRRKSWGQWDGWPPTSWRFILTRWQRRPLTASSWKRKRTVRRWKLRGGRWFHSCLKNQMTPNYLGKWSNLTSNGLKPPGCWVLMIPLHLCLDQRIREVADSVWHTVLLKQHPETILQLKSYIAGMAIFPYLLEISWNPDVNSTLLDGKSSRRKRGY